MKPTYKPMEFTINENTEKEANTLSSALGEYFIEYQKSNNLPLNSAAIGVAHFSARAIAIISEHTLDSDAIIEVGRRLFIDILDDAANKQKGNH